MISDCPSLYGALEGTVTIAPDLDLTEPTGEVWKATQDGPALEEFEGAKVCGRELEKTEEETVSAP